MPGSGLETAASSFPLREIDPLNGCTLSPLILTQMASQLAHHFSCMVAQSTVDHVHSMVHVL